MVRVGTKKDHVRTACLKGPRRVDQSAADLVPLIAAHELFKVAAVEAHHQDAGRVRAADALLDLLIQQPVIHRSGFPTGASDKANDPHV